MKKIFLLFAGILLINYLLQGAAPHIPASITTVLASPNPSKSHDTAANVFTILAFVLGICSLIPYLNLLALGGYLPALFHRLANKKMQKNSDTKGIKLLKAAKTLSIVGFSIYTLAALAGLIALVLAEAVPGILFVLLIAAIWGFFQLLGK